MKTKLTQPVILDKNGICRFKSNPIVEAFLSAAREGRKYDLNDAALGNFSREDYVQFAQLIGYSVCGFGDLSYVSDKEYALAEKEVKKLLKDSKKK